MVMAKLSLIHSADGGNLAVAAPFFAPNSVDQPRGLDWVHPSVECRDAGQMGLGLFANEFIPRTTPVLFFGGKIMTWREITTLPEDMWDIPFQVTDELFFGIHRRDDIGLGERINHSCNPNTGFTSEMRLIALRDIHPNQQVTMAVSYTHLTLPTSDLV